MGIEKKQPDLKDRTKSFAIQVVKFVGSLPASRTAEIMGKQLLRSATSVGANYRAACRAKSRADFIAKLAIVEEEVDETLYWLELMTETGVSRTDETLRLLAEADELTAIIVASLKRAKNPPRVLSTLS